MMEDTTFKFLVENTDVSYKDVVEATGVSKQMVSYWSKGINNIGEKHAVIIADLMGVPEAYLTVGLDLKGRLQFKKEQLRKECEKYGFNLEEL